MALEVYGRLPTVPEYYKAFIDSHVDLTEEPKQCCPFHKEDTPSFSYDGRTGRWSCFGSCHAHGDVIEMHRRWCKLPTKEAAEDDLNRICKIQKPKVRIGEREITLINQEKVEEKATFIKAKRMATTPERWIELDEVMSKYPVSEDELYDLTLKWSGQK